MDSPTNGEIISAMAKAAPNLRKFIAAGNIQTLEALMDEAAKREQRKLYRNRCWVAHSDFEGCASRSLETLLDLRPGECKEYFFAEVI